MQIQFCDPIGVVEGGAADAGAGQGHRFEFGDGGDRTGAAHLSTNAQQTGGGFFGGVFEGDGPARGLLGEAGFVLQLEVVQLHHHAVGGIGEVMATLLPVVAEAMDGGQVSQSSRFGLTRKPAVFSHSRAAHWPGGWASPGRCRV